MKERVRYMGIEARFECDVLPDVRYGDLEEQTVDIYRPDVGRSSSDELLPAVLHLHGGAWRKGDKGMLAGASRGLASRGFAVFTANYRLARRGRNRWPACWEDVRTLLEWVLDQAEVLGVDVSRIGAAGYSAGAHLAALLGTRPETAKHIRCVVDFFGPSHLGPGRRRVGQYMLFGRMRPPRATVESASPALLVSQDTPPFIIVHGCSDRMVPVEQSKILHEALLAEGTEVRLCLFEGQPHAFVRPGRNGELSPEALEAFREVSDFLSTHLGPCMPGRDRSRDSGSPEPGNFRPSRP